MANVPRQKNQSKTVTLMVKSGSGFNGLNLMCFVSLMIVQGGEQ